MTMSVDVPIKILIVDDHTILAQSMARLVNDQADMEIVSTQTSGNEAIRFLKKGELNIDLVLLDLQMEETDSPEPAGLKVAKYIMETLYTKGVREIQVIIISQFTDGYLIDLAHKMGVHGYLSKDCESQELFDAIRWVARKKRRYFRGKIEQSWDEFNYQQTGTQQIPVLTPTEYEILELIAQGLTTRDISQIRKRGVDGIEAHRRNIMRKFGAKNAPHMIALAYHWGLIKA